MCPERSLSNQRGAGLPIAIFIRTVLALVVIGMAQLQQGSGEAVSLQIQSQRAFFAAESGAQVAVTDVLYQGRACPSGGSNWSINFTESALAGCMARLTCSPEDASQVDGGGGNTLYTIESRGLCGSGADQAERVVEVRVR